MVHEASIYDNYKVSRGIARLISIARVLHFVPHSSSVSRRKTCYPDLQTERSTPARVRGRFAASTVIENWFRGIIWNRRFVRWNARVLALYTMSDFLVSLALLLLLL